MYELIRLSEHDYYIDCPAKIGVVDVGDGKVILIDSGSDKDAGKKILRVLIENHWTLEAVFNTHSHADHIGGNRCLQDKTGCCVYTRGLEKVFTQNPILEPIGLYGGLPFSDLKHKFLLAQESNAQYLTNDILPDGWQLLELPGHCTDMVGFLTPDGTAFIADSVSSEATLSKYGIGYMWDPDNALVTLKAMRSLKALRYVPSHAEVTENILPLLDINEHAILAVKEKITALLNVPQTFEELLKKIFDAYGMQMTAQQYALIGSTLRSYLSCMYTTGIVTFEFSDNRMIWKQKNNAE